MSVDALALEKTPSRPSIAERVVGFAKGKLNREKTPEEVKKAEAVEEFKKVSARLYDLVNTARHTFQAVPQTFSKMGGRSIAPEHRMAFDTAFAAYRASVFQYQEFLFNTHGSEVAKQFLDTEADKLGGVHHLLLATKLAGVVGALGTVAIAGGYKALASFIPGIVVSKTLRSKWAIGTVDEKVSSEIRRREVEAINEGKTYREFVRENAEIIKKRKLSKAWRFTLRWTAGLATSVGAYAVLNESMGQMSAGLFDQVSHNMLAERFGENAAESLANGTGDYALWMSYMSEVSQKALGGAVTLVAGGRAMAAEVPMTPENQGLPTSTSDTDYSPLNMQDEIEGRRYFVSPTDTGEGGMSAEVRIQLITHFGSAPWARSLTEALSPRSINEAADVLIRGGMNPEAREEFIAAATAFRNNQNPEFVDFTRREWEAQAFRTRGVPRVLGDGADRVLFDASREPGFRGEHPPVYRALKMPFTYTDARGILHTVMVEIPIGKADGSGEQDCYNFSLYSDEIVPPPGTPETFIPPVPPETITPPVAPRTLWSEQSGFVAQDCTDCGSEMKVTNLRILEYRGESLEEARRYMVAAVSEQSAWEGYQQNMSNKFVYLKFHNTLTGTDTYHCLSLRTGTFSEPTIVTGSRTEVVRTAEQFDGLVTGTSEEWRMIGGARSARDSDISVLSPKDPMPLFAEDIDGDGRPNRFVPGIDINGNGILEAGEVGRSLNEVVNNQIYLIGNDIIPQETGDPNAQANLERVFLSRIPEDFIQGRSEGARFAALKAEFGGTLSDEQIRELGRWLHFYDELHKTPAHPDGAAAFRNPDGSPKVIFQFLREGITETARPRDGSVGDFPDLRRAQ